MTEHNIVSTRLLLAFTTLSFAACGAPPGHPTRGIGYDLGVFQGGNNDGGIDPGMGSQDMECGGQQFAVTRNPPNVMLVIDQSGSMADTIDGSGTGSSKWDDLVTALDSVLTTYGSQVRFGADLFADASSFDGCGPGQISVNVGPNTASAIKSQLAAVDANGGPSTATPTASTLDVVIQSGELRDRSRPNFVVIATDGLPNCSDTDVLSRINTLYNSTPSVKTYVIGIGQDTESDPTALNSWAVAGHTAQTGAATQYYQANSPQDLQNAFNAIAGGVVSCTFTLSQQPPDPSQLYIWENSSMVPASATDGYEYDMGSNSITLTGSYCDQLKNNPNTKVQVVYGCPNMPIM